MFSCISFIDSKEYWLDYRDTRNDLTKAAKVGVNPAHTTVLSTTDSALINFLKVWLRSCTFSKHITGKWSHRNTAQTLITHVANGTQTTSTCSLPSSTCYWSVWSSARLWLMRAAETLQGGRAVCKSAQREKMALFCHAECHMELLLVKASWQALRKLGGGLVNMQEAWNALLCIILHI